MPDLDCLEYLFDADGAMAPDPGNPDQVDGAFGPHSWLAMPGYLPPAWLDAARRGSRLAMTVGGSTSRSGSRTVTKVSRCRCCWSTTVPR